MIWPGSPERVIPSPCRSLNGLFLAINNIVMKTDCFRHPCQGYILHMFLNYFCPAELRTYFLTCQVTTGRGGLQREKSSLSQKAANATVLC